MWWRRAGVFSGPLLANPRFRAVFLCRVKEILETVYTEDICLPLIDDMTSRLEDDARLRAELWGLDPKPHVERLRENAASLREHLRKRRPFLLEQKELTCAEDGGKPGGE